LAFNKQTSHSLVTDSFFLGNAAHRVVNYCAIQEPENPITAASFWRISIFGHPRPCLSDNMSKFNEPSTK